MLGKLMLCNADCEVPWFQPGENAPCYAISEDIYNYWNADKVHSAIGISIFDT